METKFISATACAIAITFGLQGCDAPQESKFVEKRREICIVDNKVELAALRKANIDKLASVAQIVSLFAVEAMNDHDPRKVASKAHIRAKGITLPAETNYAHIDSYRAAQRELNESMEQVMIAAQSYPELKKNPFIANKKRYHETLMAAIAADTAYVTKMNSCVARR